MPATRPSRLRGRKLSGVEITDMKADTLMRMLRLMYVPPGALNDLLIAIEKYEFRKTITTTKFTWGNSAGTSGIVKKKRCLETGKREP